jgi:hypothetical protein
MLGPKPPVAEEDPVPSRPAARSRSLTVDARRLRGWAQRFADEHGPVDVTGTADGLDLRAADGARAALVAAAPAGTGTAVDTGTPTDNGASMGTPVGTGAPVEAFAERIGAAHRCAVLLVRRGGYAVALLDGDDVVVSKVGTRYVQGRTAAGGWSQQRFARRRDNQTAELVGAALEHAVRILGTVDADRLLVTGGDRALVERVLADPRLRPLARLQRVRHLGVGDPRADVLRAVPGLLRQVRITVTDPGA